MAIIKCTLESHGIRIGAVIFMNLKRTSVKAHVRVDPHFNKMNGFAYLVGPLRLEGR